MDSGLENINIGNCKKIEKGENGNVYGREKFSPAESKMYVDKMKNDFGDHFSSLGYQREEPVKISSGIDSTVRFIGSGISVLKPYFTDKKVPAPGVYIQQDCIRTRNVDRFKDDNFQPNWGSYFPNLGAITPPDRIKEGCIETFEFIGDKLGIDDDDILIRINSKDKDLLSACQERYGTDNFEIDKQKEEFYMHKVGVDGVKGRSCNIALRNSDGQGFSDVANLIILEDEESKLCLEISIGVSTTLKQLYALDHVQDCTPVAGIESVDTKYRRKFEDVIITSAVLYKEGLRPFGKHNRNRILKKYIQLLSYFRDKCGIDLDRLQELIAGFEKREFPELNKGNSQILIDYIRAYENKIAYNR